MSDMLLMFRSRISLLLPYKGNMGIDGPLGTPFMAKLVMYSWRATATVSLRTLGLGPLKYVYGTSETI